MTTAALVVWALALALALAGTLYLSRLNQTVRARLDAADRALTPRLPWHGAFNGFMAGSAFEADNIVGAIAFQDEYRMAGCRFEPQDVVIDIGAHIGAFSYLCHVLGSRAIHSFEPSAANFERLRRNLEGCPGAHLKQAAVWRSDSPPEPRWLSGPVGDNTGAGSVMQARAGAAESVDAIPLDDLLRCFERVRMLKIDCEGAEFPILLTSRELARIDRIVGEAHEFDEAAYATLPPSSRIAGLSAYRAGDLRAALEAAGFEVDFQPRGDGPPLFEANRHA